VRGRREVPAPRKGVIPPREKGRFSGRKVSRVPRFSTAWSTSTWPKSGRMERSTWEWELRPHRASRPARCSHWRSSKGRVVSNFRAELRKGTHSCRGWGRRPSSPSRVGNRLTKLLSPRGTTIQRLNSRMAPWSERLKLMPQVWGPSPGLKRSRARGIFSSAVQPPSSVATALSQTPSQLASKLVSLKMTWSFWTPAALTSKTRAVLRSWLESMATPNQSDWLSWSRRWRRFTTVARPPSRVGSWCMRAPMYR